MELKHETFGHLGIIAMDGCKQMCNKVDKLILERRSANADFMHTGGDLPATYILPTEQIRFSNGEGKAKLHDTARGKDLYIICDIGNYSCTYQMFGLENHYSPDDHFQDIKRILSAIDGKSRRTTVIMPLLYASRQDKRRSRESLDCAMALQELERIGVNDILTFDVHNTSVQNAIPLVSFENLYSSHDIINSLLKDEPEIFGDNKDLLIISPDTGGMDRTVFYGSVLNSDVGLFYKRRDHTKVVNGKNPIIDHVYIGNSVEGKNILIVDDMISSGESIYDIALEIKRRGAAKIFVSMTFSLFTDGAQKMQDFYEKGIINKLYSTNLTYIPDHVKSAPWFHEVDMSQYIAKIIDHLNYDLSLAPILNPPFNSKVLKP